MAVEYGAKGVVGVLTPQANTTVEPELWALAPAHVSLINARLTSDKSTIEERLVDYTDRFSATSGQFANAPIQSIAAACTGASYLIGAAREAEIVDQVEAERGVPFITAALASVAALRAMGAERIALLSPYPGALDAACTPYWEGHGFEVIAKAGPALELDAFHPIYAMTGGGVFKAYQELAASGADAVLMLGTGMATLRPVLAGRDQGLIPAVSCNIALMWAAAQARRWDDLSGEDLAAWLRGDHWEARLNALFPL
jgi:maleate cis-trans isomerase